MRATTPPGQGHGRGFGKYRHRGDDTNDRGGGGARRVPVAVRDKNRTDVSWRPRNEDMNRVNMVLPQGHSDESEEETLKGVRNNRFSDMQNLDNMHDVQVEILDTTQIPPKSAPVGISVSGGVGSESLKTKKMGGNGDVYGSNDKGPKAVERVEVSHAKKGKWKRWAREGGMRVKEPENGI
ncbi:hypothetical protein Q3G72_025623 [Acer saccharum]|nr:hypothetical protein Q3G72_025623 [Acer saccharum]